MATIGWILLIFGFIYSTDAQTDISVVAVENPPYLYKGSDGRFTGFVPDVLELLAYNFTIHVPHDARYGFMHANGTWNGMMGEVIAGDADIAALLTITSQRARSVEFTYPVQGVGPVIVMKKPVMVHPSLRENLSKLLSPLDFSVWLISILAMLVTGTVLYIISHFNPYEWRRMSKDREATLREAESFTCLNSFFFVVSTLMWQGYVRAPRSIGARVLVICWWAFTVIFIVSYTASLTNYLRAVGTEPSAVKAYTKVRGFKDLADYDELRVGVIPHGSTERLFQQSNSATKQKIYTKMINDRAERKEDLQSTSDLISYMRNQLYSDFVVILESGSAKYITNLPPCDLFVVNEGYINRHMAFATKIGSPLGKAVSSALIEFESSQALYELEQKWFKVGCKDSMLLTDDVEYIELPTFHQLDLGTFSTALLFVVVGVVLGGFITVIEICIYKWAEIRIDEDVAEPVTNRSTNENHDSGSGDRLIDQDAKKGGATQV